MKLTTTAVTLLSALASSFSLQAAPLLNQGARVANTDLVISSENPQLPETLSNFPALFQAANGDGSSIPGVVLYKPASVLFSDFAAKERFLALPGLDQMSYTEGQGFNMPEGTIVVKNFLLPIDERDPENSLKRIESRVMLFEQGSWTFETYEWNDEETDATKVSILGKNRNFTLTDPDGDDFPYTWRYPSLPNCLKCHTSAANFTLGLNTAALNSEIMNPATMQPENQFESLRSLGYFSDAPATPVSELPALADYSDPTETLENRFKAYVASNCSMCHRPDGGTPVEMDLRWEIPVDQMEIIDVAVQREDFGVMDPKRIDTARPDESILLYRLSSLDFRNEMPPNARNRVDQENVDLILEWVESLSTGNHSDLFIFF